MNERIEQLAGQALDRAVPYTWHNLDHVEMEKVMKVFADLLIRETLDVARAGVEYGDGMDSAVYRYFGLK